VIITTAAVLLVGAIGAEPGDYTVSISQADMTTYTPAKNDSLGSYYLLEFQLPTAAQGRELDAAILEFCVDVDAFARLDITDIIQPILNGNATNYGLVIGSIGGLRDGKFTLRSDILGNGTVARVRLYLLPAE
jgi:hypothetical protein